MSETGAIAQIDRARQFLAQAKDLSDIKLVRDMAEAARLYARAAGLGQEAMNEAAEIRLRAERKAGETLKAMPKHPGGRPSETSTDSVEVSEGIPTIPNMGISHRQASEWQLEASLPEEDFEALIADTKKASERLTTDRVVQEAKRRRDEQRAERMNGPRQESEGPVNVQNIHDANLRATFQRWLLEATKIAALSPSRIAEVLTVADAQRAEESLDRFVAWVDAFKSARADGSGLRAIGER